MPARSASCSADSLESATCNCDQSGCPCGVAWPTSRTRNSRAASGKLAPRFTPQRVGSSSIANVVGASAVLVISSSLVVGKCYTVTCDA